MNLVKSHNTKLIHRNLLHSYALTTEKIREINETISLTVAPKRIKYLGVNLPEETKNVGRKLLRHLWKKSKTTQIDGEIYHVLGLEDSIL